MEECMRTKSMYILQNVAFVVGQVLAELRVLQYFKVSEAETPTGSYYENGLS